MDIDVAATASPAELRGLMVDRLRRNRLVCTTAVEAAMRAVPRHLFVPDATVERAYSPETIVTHRDAEGVALSSSSAPGVVASMLDQLDVQPGHRVLEIGAGTGYNAALLAHLAGPAGEVTTVDIDGDVARGACESLTAALADQAARAAGVLWRIGWGRGPLTGYHDRFLDRYGQHRFVPRGDDCGRACRTPRRAALSACCVSATSGGQLPPCSPLTAMGGGMHNP